MNISRKSEKKTLLINTVMLYIMQFSTYLLGFAVIPYETRILGDTQFGVLGVATSMMNYFQLIIDFGFILSATEDVSRNRENTSKISTILTSVTLCKLTLSVLSAVALLALCQLIPQWQGNSTFYMLFLISTALNSLMPDYIYRGLEKMTAITVRAVAIKVFFTGMIFLFLKSPGDICIIPILNIIGNAIALVCVYVHLNKKLRIPFGRFDPREFWHSFRRSLFFFFSRIASAIYTDSNTLILSIITSNGGATGLYSAASKVTTTAKNAMSPIADSLYPYMTKNKDFKLVKKVLLLAMPVIVLGCAIVFVFAEPLCVWFFGDEFAGTGAVLRALLPVVVVILPSYVLGFPTLSAMGLSKHANYSVIFGSVLHVAGLLLLYLTNNMNMITLACMVSVTETVIMLYRVVVVLSHKSMLRQTEEREEPQ